jgi:hypothetical protein
MQSTPYPVKETLGRQRRRRIAPLVGAIAGAIVGLVVAGLVDLFDGTVTPVAYLGGVLVGAVIGLVLAMLVPAEMDDGEDDAHAAPFGHDALRGRADAPVEGAHARDTSLTRPKKPPGSRHATGRREGDSRRPGRSGE